MAVSGIGRKIGRMKHKNVIVRELIEEARCDVQDRRLECLQVSLRPVQQIRDRAFRSARTGMATQSVNNKSQACPTHRPPHKLAFTLESRRRA